MDRDDFEITIGPGRFNDSVVDIGAWGSGPNGCAAALGIGRFRPCPTFDRDGFIPSRGLGGQRLRGNSTALDHPRRHLKGCRR